MKNVSALILGIALLGVGACKPAAESIPDDRMTAFERAFNAGDAAGVAALYAEDATLMPPNAPAVKGRAAIESYMRDSFAQGPAQISVTTDEAFTANGTGVRRGTFQLKSPEGQELESGKYVEIWKKTGDKWELCIDIWNLNTAAAPAAPPPAPEAPPAPSAQGAGG